MAAANNNSNNIKEAKAARMTAATTAEPAEDAPVSRTTSNGSADVWSEGDVGVGKSGRGLVGDWSGGDIDAVQYTNDQRPMDKRCGGQGGGQILPRKKMERWKFLWGENPETDRR